MRRDTPVVFESLVADATMAASSHNTQPWRFEIGENLIRIVPDFTRRCPYGPEMPKSYRRPASEPDDRG